MNKVFVYGTLKRGNSNSMMLHNQTYLGDGSTKKKYVMYDAGIPFVVEDNLSYEGDTPTLIRGELWMVSNQVVKELDALEGHPYAYRRTTVSLIMDDATEDSAFMYLFTVTPRGEYVPSGEYVERRRVTQPATGQQQETTTRTNY